MDISYLEIYNEKIIDLLSGSPSSQTTSQSNQDLKIRDDVDFGTKVVGLTSANISSKPQLLQLIKYGDTNRKPVPLISMLDRRDLIQFTNKITSD